MIYDELAEKFWGLKLDPSISLDSFLEVRIEIESDLQTLQKYISIYLLFLSIYSYFHRSTKSIHLEICVQCPGSRSRFWLVPTLEVRV